MEVFGMDKDEIERARLEYERELEEDERALELEGEEIEREKQEMAQEAQHELSEEEIQAAQRGEIHLSAWEAQELSAFLEETGHEFYDLERDDVLKEAHEFGRRWKRRNWWRWPLLRWRSVSFPIG